VTAVGLIVFALFFLVPAWVAWLLRRRVPGALFAAALTWAYVAVFARAVFANHASTSALAFLVLPFLEAAVFAGALALGWAASVWLRSGSAPRTRLLALPILVLGLATALGLTRFLVLEAQLCDPNAGGPALARAHADYASARRVYDAYAGWLGRGGSTHPLSRLAVHDAAPAQVLEALAADTDASIVQRAASNSNLGADSLRRIGRDDPQARRWLARNPNTPPDQLAALAVDAEAWLALELARHPQLPEELREGLFERAAVTDNDYVRIHAAIQPQLPPRLLRQLARDPKPLARRNVAANRATPRDVLETLSADPDESVSSMAKHMLERRAREGRTG
jgi:hypothetical protein